MDADAFMVGQELRRLDRVLLGLVGVRVRQEAEASGRVVVEGLAENGQQPEDGSKEIWGLDYRVVLLAVFTNHLRLSLCSEST